MIYWYLVRIFPFYQQLVERLANDFEAKPFVTMIKIMIGILFFGVIIPKVLSPIIPFWITTLIIGVLAAPLIFLGVIEYWTRVYKNLRR